MINGRPLLEALSEPELGSKLQSRTKAAPERPQPDWRAIHERLQQHHHRTLQLTVAACRQAYPEVYRYSWFCERSQQRRPCHGRGTAPGARCGREDVCRLGRCDYSRLLRQHTKTRGLVCGYSWVPVPAPTQAATRDQQLEAWIQAHIISRVATR